MDGFAFELRTLGPVDLRSTKGVEVGPLLAQPKRLGILVYLRVAGGGGFLRRDTLLAMFWPESPDDRARGALNKAIYFLRRFLGRESVRSRGADEVAIDAALVWCDASAFDDAVDAGRLAEAVGLYRGPFLDAFHGPRSAEFELWVEAERERLARRYAEALEALALDATNGGRFAEAVRWWRRLVDAEPLRSRATVGLMEALEATGDRGAAIREAERHAERLRDELDAEPEPEVRAVANRLRGAPETRSIAWRPDSRAGSAHPVESGEATEPEAAGPMGPRARGPAVFITGVAAALAIFLLAGRGDRGPVLPDEAIASDAALTIAVLPFEATDSTTALYREGMAHLISVGLDGLGGVRTISSRTVLSRWETAGSVIATGDSTSAISVARDMGASYVVLGTAARIGAQLRLTADVYEVSRSRHLGRVEASGSPDSLIGAAEALTAGIARTVLGEAAPALHLSALTTSSLLALRAYLEGEDLFRRSDFAGAIAAYERAVREDSTFALAYYRLGWAHGWAGEATPPVFSEQAMRHGHRLPSREASLVRAYYLWLHGPASEGVNLAREIVQKWPDEAEGWNLLGEYHRHLGGAMMSRPLEGERAFARAVALDPDFAPYHHHHVEYAFLAADSAEAARRIAAYTNAAAGEPIDHAYQLGFALAFGDDADRAQALVEADTLSTEILRRASHLLVHARFLPRRVALLRMTTARRDVPVGEIAQDLHRLGGALLYQGRFREVESLLNDPNLPPGWPEHLASWLDVGEFRDQERPPWTDHHLFTHVPSTWLVAGAAAVDRDRPNDLAAIRTAIEREVESRMMAGDSLEALRFAAMGNGIEGYRLWRANRGREAFTILEEARQGVVGFGYGNGWSPVLRGWLGRLSLELERPQDAVRYLESLRQDLVYPASPFVAYDLARAREMLGDPRGAIEAYRYALEAWRDADPELQPRIDHARRQIAILEAWT